MKIVNGIRKYGKRGKRAPKSLVGYTPEQRQQHFREYRREYKRKNRKKIQEYNHLHKLNFSLKPHRQCAGCLYRIGFTGKAIAEIIHISKENVSRIITALGINGKRTPSKFSRNVIKRISYDEIARRLLARNHRKETNALKLYDESRYWWRHPIRIGWSSLKISNKIYRARAEKKLMSFKCQFCGCDVSKLSPKRRRAGLKYCSENCYRKAQNASEKIRLHSDPVFKKRRRAYAKKCYERKRRERPDAYRESIRLREANPRYRMAKNLRNRIASFVRRGLMNKIKGTSKLTGCSWGFLQHHLESKFKRGMTWGNYGKVWHIDHIIPLSKFDLMKPEECDLACNWQNIQPMFGSENLAKSNKIFDPQQALPLAIT